MNELKMHLKERLLLKKHCHSLYQKGNNREISAGQQHRAF